MRERDSRNGMKELLGPSWFAKIPYLPNILAHPGWLASFLRDGGVPKLENVATPGNGPTDLIDVAAALASAPVPWKVLRWFPELWPAPFVLKGPLPGIVARRA